MPPSDQIRKLDKSDHYYGKFAAEKRTIIKNFIKNEAAGNINGYDGRKHARATQTGDVRLEKEMIMKEYYTKLKGRQNIITGHADSKDRECF